MDFDFLEKKFSVYNIKIVKKIFSDITDTIKENVLTLHNLIDQDNKKYFEKLEYSKLLKIIEKVENEDWLLLQNTKEYIYYGIGNIGVCYNGNSDLFLYLVLKALKTGNNIVFFEDNEIHQTSKFLLNMIDNICKKNKYVVCSKIIKYNKIADFSDNTSNFEMFIFINEQQKYFDFSARAQSGLKIICSNYGTMDLYLADKDLKDTLYEMDDYVYKNSIDVEIYKDENVESVVEKININKHNYCAAIFTKNMKDAYYFVRNVNAQKIFVNRNPAEDYEFYLSDENLTLHKQIYI